MIFVTLISVGNHNRIPIILKEDTLSKLFYTDKSDAKWGLKKVKFDLAKQCVAFVISFVIWWVHFNYYIVFICAQLMHVIFIVFTKEDCIWEN